MGDENWYRRKTWTATDRIEFNERNARSRGARSKAQYARIQAYELQQVGTASAIAGAIELLEQILIQWSSEAELAAVYQQYGQCQLLTGKPNGAISSFRKAFEAQRAKPGSKTTTHLDFGWLCITQPIPELHKEVLGVLDEFQYPQSFPIHTFKDAAIRAIIHSSEKESEIARMHAERALSAIGGRSIFKRHAGIGLVGQVDPSIEKKLRAIAA
ncbi:MAG: hypothetical protein OEL20_06845 [Sulfuritalea sp.]|nr:hypothetical protein [Sulfuritalea sp.]